MAMPHPSNTLRSTSTTYSTSPFSVTSYTSLSDNEVLAWLESHEQARSGCGGRSTQSDPHTNKDTTPRLASSSNANSQALLSPASGYNPSYTNTQEVPGHYEHITSNSRNTLRPSPPQQKTPANPRDGGPVYRCFEHGCGGRSFSNIENYRRHIREKTSNIQCPFCYVSFTRKSNRDAHVSSGRCKLEALDTWLVEATSGWEDQS